MMKMKKATSLSLPKEQVDKIVEVQRQEVAINCSLTDEEEHELYAEYVEE